MRYDFHTHTVFSDGELIPSELVRRAVLLEHAALAITDHGDASNYRELIEKITLAREELERYWDIRVIVGIELTHIPPKSIPKMARRCKDFGAEIVVVHGETVVEPVEEGTNYYASISEDVDILAHPGLIDRESAGNIKENSIFLEITSRKGHSLTNGHVMNVARDYNIPVLINTDAHSPTDLIDVDFARKVGLGCGMSKRELENVLYHYPQDLIKRL
ncbi:MAG TPA: histidinol phosphate phosphatase domain-containing protein [Methanothermococcus okinawensis]|uniref:Histidinol phosphate phosphatase domain-containing protein n=1 Tax=Methanothermococcus okinawensis TaxID=155863 RepID=A0A833E3H5_9EURY|nr:histidinol phosphate phosphatase domain-containing protein [Methanococcaceae archaeon]HIP84849.1 histidinol phosphate phosphatase domain-containing protein [Methanothermococcus okinawensis]HIP90697.1 histidinol phosphate phosphatase domain-containing protein [Methanothermococcus okinawensis]